MLNQLERRCIQGISKIIKNNELPKSEQKSDFLVVPGILKFLAHRDFPVFKSYMLSKTISYHFINAANEIRAMAQLPLIMESEIEQDLAAQYFKFDPKLLALKPLLLKKQSLSGWNQTSIFSKLPNTPQKSKKKAKRDQKREIDEHFAVEPKDTVLAAALVAVSHDDADKEIIESPAIKSIQPANIICEDDKIKDGPEDDFEIELFQEMAWVESITHIENTQDQSIVEPMGHSVFKLLHERDQQVIVKLFLLEHHASPKVSSIGSTHKSLAAY